ncbi:MAG TPA: hypothetical protein VHM19_18590 [Polyangiales bacterium]|nr:hypothetical protein [Polyangiales bacterium]
MTIDHIPAKQPAALRGSHRGTLLLLCGFAYLYVFPYQAQLNNPNENVRFYMTASLAEQGSYAIDMPRARWGWVNDGAVHGGHFWSVKAPGTSFSGVPGYYVYWKLSQALGHAFDRTEALWVCRVTACVLPTLLFAFFFYGFLARHARHALARNTVFVSTLLGSLLYGYGMMFVSHTVGAVLAFAAFMGLWSVRHGEREADARGAFLAGLGCAAATFYEYPGLACSLPLAVYGVVVLRKPKLLAAFALGGVLPALIMMHFQWRAFGSPFTPGHLYVENDSFRAAHHQGLYGAVGPSAYAMYGLLIDPGAGLFPLTPLLVLALPGLYRMLRDEKQRADAITILAVVVLTVLAISSMNNWRGGWTVGPRYLAVCVPFLAWPALRALDDWLDRMPLMAAGFALAACAVGLIASGLPSAYYPHLPPELERPLPQVYAVLIAHGYAPMNAAALVNVFSGASMLPLLACALGVLACCVVAITPGLRWRATALAVAVALVLAVPLWIRPSKEPGVAGAVAFITRNYWPSGHDAASRLRDRLRVQPTAATPENLERLAELYREEGRQMEAQRAKRGRL